MGAFKFNAIAVPDSPVTGAMVVGTGPLSAMRIPFGSLYVLPIVASRHRLATRAPTMSLKLSEDQKSGGCNNYAVHNPASKLHRVSVGIRNASFALWS